ncbi:MAG: hypothetical protein HRU21_12995, partial [Pseudomonadales bacterium]|nr:hypothetical protein [Pseudomonadales bacterium]
MILLKRLCIVFSLLAVTSCLEGTIFDFSDNSVVYLTNNTAKPVSINIVTNAPDDVWRLKTQQLEPYKTRPIVEINRDRNYSKGTIFPIDIQLIDEDGNQLSLTTEISYGGSSTDFRYGAATSVNSIDLTSTSSRVAKTFDYHNQYPQGVNIALQAEQKALYKDVFYAITPEPEFSAVNTSASELSILTYNIWGLPGVSRDIAERFALMPKFLRNYDVLVLQEAYSADRASLFAKLA